MSDRDLWAQFVAKREAKQQAVVRNLTDAMKLRAEVASGAVALSDAAQRAADRAFELVRAAAEGQRRSKLGNRATYVDGIRFPSKLQADRYRELVLLRSSGAVLWFLREVPFDVAPGVVYRADFLVVWDLKGRAAEFVTVEDTKGHLTDTSRVKIAVVEERYGIKVKLLRRADVRRFGAPT